MPDYTIVYLGLGSNVGDREHFLMAAEQHVLSHNQVSYITSSSIYETEPMGGPAQEKYLNKVLAIKTQMSSQELLVHVQHVESTLGRKRTCVNGPRTIDIDILFFGNQVLNSLELIIPHPRIEQRFFVLVPLAEITSSMRHPVTNLTVCDMLESLQSQRGAHYNVVKKIKDSSKICR